LSSTVVDAVDPVTLTVIDIPSVLIADALEMPTTVPEIVAPVRAPDVDDTAEADGLAEDVGAVAACRPHAFTPAATAASASATTA
jgi:hypothetical protein